jgi:hypothetical protein
VRQARAKPLLNQLHRWFEQKLATLSAKSDTAAAIRYSLSRWPALTRYVDDRLIEIFNSSNRIHDLLPWNIQIDTTEA